VQIPILTRASPEYEDFTTYIEEDPNLRLEKISTRVTFSGITRAESAYVYKDFGSGYYSGDFKFKIDIRYTSCVLNSFIHVWGVFNGIGDREEADGDPKNFLSVYIGGEGTDNAKFVLAGYYDGAIPVGGWDQWTGPIVDTTYYLTIKRTGVVFTCDIYPTDTDRTDETNALDNLSNTMAGVTAYRYVYVCQSMTYVGSYPISGYVEYLEIIMAFSITFNYNVGGILLVNRVTTSNGTTSGYSNGTVIEVLGITENSSYIFLSFNWTNGSATSSPYNYTVTQNTTIWCYFDEPNTKITAGFIIVGIFVTIAVCGVIIIKRNKL